MNDGQVQGDDMENGSESYPNRNFRYRSKEMSRISFPIVVEQIFMTLMGIVNTMMVSRVGEYAHISEAAKAASKAGEYALTAVSMIDSISQLLIAFFAALTTGGTIVVSQYIGRGEKGKATEAGAQALTLGLLFSMFIMLMFLFFGKNIVGLLFQDAVPEVLQNGLTYIFIVNFSFPIIALMQTLFGIMRGSGDTRTPMLITVFMNLINLPVGWILIVGFRLPFLHMEFEGFGVAGAAWAMFICRLIGFAIALWIVVFRSKTIRINKWVYFKPNFAMQKVVLGLGVPTSIESSLFQFGKIITQLYIFKMGSASMAANAVASSISGFINVPGNSFATGAMILVGQRIGRGETGDVKKTILFAVKLGTIFMTGICLLFFPFTGLLMHVYNLRGEAALITTQILYSNYIVTPFFWAMSFMTPAGLRATGDVKYTMIVAVATMWTLRIFLGYFLGVFLQWGVLGIWVAMYVDWVGRSLFFMLRLYSGKWQGRGVRD